MNSASGKWEKRWHPLREEWVVYSAHRNTRPWHGAPPVESQPMPAYDPTCYLCPGNKRVNHQSNPHYSDIFIFENDLPVVSFSAPDIPVEQTIGLYRKARATGVAKVICYDPRHNVTLAQMKQDAVYKVFRAFRQEMTELSKIPEIRYVHIFENKGQAVGVSNPHPHCQLYATDFVFKFVEQQLAVAEKYRSNHQRNIYEDIIRQEQLDEIRIIAENEYAISFLPFFARYAYETLIFPKKHHASLITLTDYELEGLTAVFHETVRKMDMNFNTDFPYVMSVMQAPVDGLSYPEFRMHLWLQPPYRQPGLIKYLAGPEIGGGNFMADTMPEDKAAELRAQDAKKYPFEK
ncbi:MAG: galactose-1-phosphate uridylyltransferase [Cyclobacteriaceae bacterium]|nr:galactose-1-phosphate uridylyltransferase [Cyclobacteriaceae bacterium]